MCRFKSTILVLNASIALTNKTENNDLKYNHCIWHADDEYIAEYTSKEIGIYNETEDSIYKFTATLLTMEMEDRRSRY